MSAEFLADAGKRVEEHKRFWEVRARLRKQNRDTKRKKVVKDSSIKKVNGILRKLKFLADNLDSVDSICEDIAKLKLSKFLSEIEKILFALKISKMKEIEAVMHICSVLSNDYPEFSDNFESKLVSDVNNQFKTLRSAKSKEQLGMLLEDFEKSQRRNLRIAAEFSACGVFSDDAVLVDLVKSLIAKDKAKNEYFIIPGLVANFLRHSGEICVGVVSKSLQDDYQSLDLEPPQLPKLLEESTSNELSKNIFSFYSKYVKRLIKLDKLKIENETESIKLLSMSGTLSETQIGKNLKIYNAFGRLHSIVASISDSLNKDFPKVSPVPVEATANEVFEKFQRHIMKDKIVELFDNELTRVFYEDFPDLSMYILNKNQNQIEQKTSEMVENVKKQMEINKLKNEIGSRAPTTLNASDSSSECNSALNQLITDLYKTDTWEKLDLIAERYCLLAEEKNNDYFIERLINTNHKQEGRIIYNCRLIATLSKYFPDLKEKMVKRVENRFHGQLKGKSLSLSNSTFISEMAKFGILPTYTLLNILKKCTSLYSYESVVVTCNILQCCGRWMYKNPLTRMGCEKIVSDLQTASRKNSFDPTLKCLIDLACSQCDPPPITKKQREKLKPELVFVDEILFCHLKRENAESVYRMLREMDWQDLTVVRHIKKALISVDKYSHSKLHLIASIITALDRFHSIGSYIIDDLVEEIRISLEFDYVHQTQRRIAIIQLLGELYIYRLVQSDVIFDLLYLLIFFVEKPENKDNNLEKNKNAQNEGIKISSSSQYRIKLVCALLYVCGLCFSRIKIRMKLHKFLFHFQRFVFVEKAKRLLDIEVENEVDQILKRLRPDCKRFKNLREFEEHSKKYNIDYPYQQTNTFDENDSIDENINGDALPTDTARAIIPEQTTKKEIYEMKSYIFDETETDSVETGDSQTDSEWSEEKLVKTQDDLDFEREFENTVKESMALRKFEKKMITINDAKAYIKKTKNLDRKKFTMITKRKGDCKPVFNPIAIKANFFTRTEENMNEDKENKEMKEYVIRKMAEEQKEENLENGDLDGNDRSL